MISIEKPEAQHKLNFKINLISERKKEHGEKAAFGKKKMDVPSFVYHYQTE